MLYNLTKGLIMGDRGNIVVRHEQAGVRLDGTTPIETPEIWLYTHWSGSEIKTLAQNGLRRAVLDHREDDPPYLTRIIFQTLLDGDTSTRGYGISAAMGDNEHPIVVVDVAAKTVSLMSEPDDGKPAGTLASLSFDDFLALSKEELEAWGRTA